ncbi:MAG: hypothetical protein JRE19_19925, partial [Deltaproteobacteria bacterium]|nr:hypothetical protein [Deltaproteobacteria bacterium]
MTSQRMKKSRFGRAGGIALLVGVVMLLNCTADAKRKQKQPAQPNIV